MVYIRVAESIIMHGLTIMWLISSPTARRLILSSLETAQYLMRVNMPQSHRQRKLKVCWQFSFFSPLMCGGQLSHSDYYVMAVHWLLFTCLFHTSDVLPDFRCVCTFLRRRGRIWGRNCIEVCHFKFNLSHICGKQQEAWASWSEYSVRHSPMLLQPYFR